MCSLSIEVNRTCGFLPCLRLYSKEPSANKYPAQYFSPLLRRPILVCVSYEWANDKWFVSLVPRHHVYAVQAAVPYPNAFDHVFVYNLILRVRLRWRLHFAGRNRRFQWNPILHFGRILVLWEDQCSASPFPDPLVHSWCHAAWYT